MCTTFAVTIEHWIELNHWIQSSTVFVHMHHTRLGSSLQIQPLSDPSKILSLVTSSVMVCIQLFYFNKKYRIKRRANFEFSTSSGWLAVEIRYLEHRLCCPCAVLTLSSHGRTSIPLPHGTLHDKGDASRSCLPFPGTKKTTDCSMQMCANHKL